MSFYTMAFFGMTPVRQPARRLARRPHRRAARRCWSAASAASLGAAWFARALPELRREVRPIYVRLGILPELADGVEQATRTVSSIPPRG